MQGMFAACRIERDATGRLVVSAEPSLKLLMGTSMVMPLIFLGVAFYSVGNLPWFIVAGVIAASLAGSGTFAWIAGRSKFRVTINKSANKLVVERAGGPAEVAIRDFEHAEFEVRPATSESGPSYRLALVLHNGERVPATTLFFGGYSGRMRRDIEQAINNEVQACSAMLQ